MAKVKNISNESGMSVTSILALLEMMEKKRAREEEDSILPNNFEPYRDTKFLISFADSPDLGKKLLIDLDTKDLKRLRAEIDAALRAKEGD